MRSIGGRALKRPAGYCSTADHAVNDVAINLHTSARRFRCILSIAPVTRRPPRPEFVPAAAAVSIQGRVRMANGKGIRNVEITLTEADGTTRTTLSGISGKYSFADVAAGQTIVLSASARRFGFSQSSQVLNLSEELGGIDFTGLEQSVSSR